MNEYLKLTIDMPTLRRYEEVYFKEHPRAHISPIKQPYVESINQWMIMKRPAMNALKQRWKDFIVWLANDAGLADKKISKCEIVHTVFFETNRRHDLDNTVPKFILDGLVEAGVIIDDNINCITWLSLKGRIDKWNPRTEILIKTLD